MNSTALWRAAFVASTVLVWVLTPASIAVVWLMRLAHRAQDHSETREIYARARRIAQQRSRSRACRKPS